MAAGVSVTAWCVCVFLCDSNCGRHNEDLLVILSDGTKNGAVRSKMVGSVAYRSLLQ